MGHGIEGELNIRQKRRKLTAIWRRSHIADIRQCLGSPHLSKCCGLKIPHTEIMRLRPLPRLSTEQEKSRATSEPHSTQQETRVTRDSSRGCQSSSHCPLCVHFHGTPEKLQQELGMAQCEARCCFLSSADGKKTLTRSAYCRDSC